MIAKREPWPFQGQCEACGLEVPRAVRDGWLFEAARLFVHMCADTTCEPCGRARRAGWETFTVTSDAVLDGRALDRVAGALSRRGVVQAALF